MVQLRSLLLAKTSFTTYLLLIFARCENFIIEKFDAESVINSHGRMVYVMVYAHGQNFPVVVVTTYQ